MESPNKKACIHTLVIGDYQPEMCKLTLPNLKAYADKIGADFNIISTRKFPEFPINFERFQVWEDGRDYMYNLCIDSDYVIHPDTPNCVEYFDKRCVGSLWSIDLRYYFKWNDYFERDGRSRGMADGLVMSTWLTHELWTPPDKSFEELKGNCLHDERQVSEFVLSLNMARFGLKYSGVFQDHSQVFSVMATSSAADGTAKDTPENRIKEKLREWNQ